MSDDYWTEDTRIEASERGAVYDGLICYGEDWIVVIENKPRASQIRAGQLRPNLAADSQIEVDDRAVSLSWRDIIRQLGSLLERGLLDGAQREIVSDFLWFVDEHFPYLNPYTQFGICKDNGDLLDRRCFAILEDLRIGPVEPHRGWHTEIVLSSGAARRIALFPRMGQEGEWDIILSINPGDTMAQAREFFETVQRDEFLSLTGRGWWLANNLHFSFGAKNLVWPSTQLDSKDYLDYWRSHKDQIRQHARGRSQFQDLFNAFFKDKLVTLEDLPAFDVQFTQTQRNSINVCPGWSLEFKWSKPEAAALDKRGDMIEAVRTKIEEAFGTWAQALPRGPETRAA